MGTLAQTVLPFKLEATEELRMLKSDAVLATVLKWARCPAPMRLAIGNVTRSLPCAGVCSICRAGWFVMPERGC